MAPFDTTYSRSVNSSPQLWFFIMLVAISPKSCTSARFLPRSTTELKRAVDNCVRQLPKCSIAGWDVSKVTDMAYMFQGATSFNGDISKWEVSSVSNMNNMFRNAASFNHNLCGARWVHSQATKTDMFINSLGSISRTVCTSTRPASNGVCATTRPALSSRAFSTKTKKVISSKKELQTEIAEHLKQFPTGDCRAYYWIGAIGDWDVSRVTDMADLFSGKNFFKADISKWDVSRVTDMSGMFKGATSFDGDLSKWDVSRVTDMTDMFLDASAFKGGLSKWDVSNVKYMRGMFSGASAFDDRLEFSSAVDKLHILIGGGSGFVGTALVSSLRMQGHDVKIISRTPSSDESELTWDDIERDGLPTPTDAVINLAGSNIMDFKRLWTCEYKEQCVTSRVSTTKLLAQAISASAQPPSVWISTSAVGFYPPSKDTVYDEQSVVSNRQGDWASELCASIEKAAEIPDPKASTRSVVMRTGIVLGEGGGAYDNMRLPFSMCLGGTFGDGSQWFPYVHLKDVVRAYEYAVFDKRPRGPLNLVAPRACTNKQFTKALGEAMNRPTLIPVPKFVSTLMGKERGSLLFEGQSVSPRALTSAGFKFLFPDATSCCDDLVGKQEEQDDSATKHIKRGEM